MTTPYTTGQISLVNGEALVTGIGTGWATSLIIGGTIYVEADGGNALPILPDDSATMNDHPITDTQLTAAIAWTGPTGTYDYALVRDTAYGQQTVANAQALAEYIQRLNSSALAALAGIAPEANKLILLTGPDSATTIDVDDVGGGSVTSVGITMPTGFSVGNSPITDSGLLAVAYATGYQAYTTAEAVKLAGMGDVGVFTPTFTFDTPGNLVVPYGIRIGTYVKVGKLVVATVNIVTGNITHTTASGPLKITGLPFASRNFSTPANTDGNVQFGSSMLIGITKSGVTDFSAYLQEARDFVYIVGSGSGVVASAVTAADMPSGNSKTIRFTICYQTD